MKSVLRILASLFRMPDSRHLLDYEHKVLLAISEMPPDLILKDAETRKFKTRHAIQHYGSLVRICQNYIYATPANQLH